MEEQPGYSYRHVYHILSSKAARVGGLPFITIPQGVAAIAGLGVGVMSKNIVLGFVLIVGGYFALSMYQGEFALLRLASILYTAVLVRINRPKTVRIDMQWQAIQTVQEKRPAAVYNLPGAAVVAGKE